MNILFMSLLYPVEQLREIKRSCKDKLQYQIDHTQHALLKGLKDTAGPGENITVVNAIPVGIWPLQYKKLFLKSGLAEDGAIFNCGCINLPVFKQWIRSKKAYAAIMDWIASDSGNRQILIYTQYLPWLKAALKAKRKNPELKVSVIVTDLPGSLGLASGRKGLLKIAEGFISNRSMDLLQKADSYVLMAEPMREVLHLENRPATVVEGFVEPADSEITACGSCEQSGRKSCLYSGTLDKDLGIPELVQAFEKMPEYELWICGNGTYSEKIKEASDKFKNIRYFGFVERNRAIALQQQADCLINPRKPDKEFTRYSFPSKTLEYLLAGKPVICYKLDGIPDEYDGFLNYIDDMNPQGICETVKKILTLSQEERVRTGRAGREFVLKNKNPKTQAGKIRSVLH